ncbi:hypothetical protein HY468_01955 [Candidatus Roizmanbacteria bacterium]|nr:hypothetical protein [Candidatus Roizmanbacteria bacterium]
MPHVPARATANFRLEMNSEYSFTENGNATVKKTVRLTNLTTNVYPSVYYLDLPEDASDVLAADDSGRIQATVTYENGSRQVKVPIKKEILGQNQSINFVLTYETRSLAKQDDPYWIITIPAFSSTEEIGVYSVRIVLPESWGIPPTIQPPSREQYFWTYEELMNNPIIISYVPLLDTPTPTPSSASPVFTVVVGVLLGISVFILLYSTGKKFLT